MSSASQTMLTTRRRLDLLRRQMSLSPAEFAEYLFRLTGAVLLECESIRCGVRCGRVFIKVKRKEYCSTLCQQRESQRRFRATRRPR